MFKEKEARKGVYAAEYIARGKAFDGNDDRKNDDRSSIAPDNGAQGSFTLGPRVYIVKFGT